MHLVPLALFGDGDTDLGQISKKNPSVQGRFANVRWTLCLCIKSLETWNEKWNFIQDIYLIKSTVHVV